MNAKLRWTSPSLGTMSLAMVTWLIWLPTAATDARPMPAVGARAEFGLGGPGGFFAARALVPVTKNQILVVEPGLGYASTGPGLGVLLSARTLTLGCQSIRDNNCFVLRLYAGGSVNHQFGRPPTGSVTPPNGTYWWLDTGLRFRKPFAEDLRLAIVIGLNVAWLAASPDLSELGANDDEFTGPLSIFIPGSYILEGIVPGMFFGVEY